MSDILIRGMEMPKNCPMCPMSHWNRLDEFTGCEIVSGKKYAMNDPEYANSDCRPDWCPLIEVPPHWKLKKMIAENARPKTDIEIELQHYKDLSNNLSVYAKMLEDKLSMLRSRCRPEAYKLFVNEQWTGLCIDVIKGPPEESN